MTPDSLGASLQGGPAQELKNLPSVLPDESLYSLVARIGLLNGLPLGAEACACLFGAVGRVNLADYPVDWERFVEATRGRYGPEDAAKHRLTVIPYFHRVGSDAPSRLLWRASPFPPSLAPSNAIQQCDGLAYVAHGNRRCWRFCPACACDEERAHGVAYWHRACQLPGAGWCLTHDSPVQFVTMGNHPRGAAIWLPLLRGDRCVLSSPPVTNEQARVLRRLSALAQAILKAESAQGRPAMHYAVMDELLARRLITPGSRLRVEDAGVALRAEYSMLAVHPEYQALLDAAVLRAWFKHFAAGRGSFSAALTVLVVAWLFGSWSAFELKCLWAKVFYQLEG